jgi:hypothetical protein
LILILAALGLFVVGYFPTLVADFAPQDDLRAFRYALAEQTPRERYDACVAMVPSFYVATGRPLAWVGECLQHARVGRIADFRPLRLWCLALALVTVLVLAYAIREWFDGPAQAVAVAAAALYAPGYSFMYFQALTAAPVMLAALLAILSFASLRRVSLAGPHPIRGAVWRLALSLGLFVTSCCIYPAYAFVAVALAAGQAAFHRQSAARDRLRRLTATLVFYGAASVAYLLVARLVIAAYFPWAHRVPPDLGVYTLAVSVSATKFAAKGADAWVYFANRLPIVNFLAWPTLVKCGIVAGIAAIATLDDSASGWRRVQAGRLLLGLAVLVVSMAIMIAPWLISEFTVLGHRHSLPWQWGLTVSVGVLAARGLSVLLPRLDRLGRSAAIIALLLVPATAQQVRLCLDEVLQSDVEIRYLRASLRQLVESGDLFRISRLHVVRPAPTVSYNGHRMAGETNTPATAANPEHVLQLARALLRELLPDTEIRSLVIDDCRFDVKCVDDARVLGHLALSQSEAPGTVVEERGVTAVVNLTLVQPVPVDYVRTPLPVAGTALSPAGLVGAWTFSGALCTVERKGEGLWLSNEHGARVTSALSGRTIFVPDWKITGEVSADGREIRWSNNTTWVRGKQ